MSSQVIKEKVGDFTHRDPEHQKPAYGRHNKQRWSDEPPENNEKDDAPYIPLASAEETPLQPTSRLCRIMEIVTCGATKQAIRLARF